ncbi:hypothetical protein M408DRAFT_11551 [Serendipita vermifera MAFF 305830]|uniref:Uncharacterized protein n=1 Tax=Serendipita vermifera MAFF 305830 TaxID=933852 RepID=A0A0C2X1F7_SERVB|nr:hypothetical protein M408DRAFT_11551 [Serendipita vermifera MAFF 305830]
MHLSDPRTPKSLGIQRRLQIQNADRENFEDRVMERMTDDINSTGTSPKTQNMEIKSLRAENKSPKRSQSARAAGNSPILGTRLNNNIFSLPIIALRYSILFTLLAYIVITTISCVANDVKESISCTVTSIWAVPLVSMMLIRVNEPTTHVSTNTLNFSNVISVQTGVDFTLRYTGVGAGVARKMLYTSLAVGDLEKQIRLSSLENRGFLVSKLAEIEATSLELSNQLGDIEAEINGAIYSFLELDKYAVESLELIKQAEMRRSFLSIFDFRHRVTVSSQRKIIMLYNQLTDTLVLSFTKATNAATKNIDLLDRLESHLNALNEIVTGNRDYEKNRWDQMLERLWNEFGRNSANVATFEKNLSLLSEVSSNIYAAKWMAHGTFEELQKLNFKVSELHGDVLFAGGLQSLELQLDVLKKRVKYLEEKQNGAKRYTDEVYRQISNSPHNTGRHQV